MIGHKFPPFWKRITPIEVHSEVFLYEPSSVEKKMGLSPSLEAASR